ILNETALAILLNPHRKYSPTVAALKELAGKYPKDATVAVAHALACVPLRDLKGAQEEFQRARNLGAEPGKVVPSQAVLRPAIDVLNNPQLDYQATAMCLQLLADQFPQNAELACLHGVALFGGHYPEQARAEFARARRLGTDPATAVTEEQLQMASQT